MSKTPLACTPHDHDHCVSHALAEADSLCARQGVRLTALRKRVLELVWQSHRPLGAYDILAVLSEQDGRRAAPPTVYRALDFLLENGLVHRIASLTPSSAATIRSIRTRASSSSAGTATPPSNSSNAPSPRPSTAPPAASASPSRGRPWKWSASARTAGKPHERGAAAAG